MKIHFSITLDMWYFHEIFGVYTPLFQHALSYKNAKCQIHLKLKVNTDISLCIAEYIGTTIAIPIITSK